MQKTIPRANYYRLLARLRMTEPRFLVVRLGSLGDIVHAFPAVSGLRISFPNAEIIWLTHPKWEFLVKTSGLATEVWTVDTVVHPVFDDFLQLSDHSSGTDRLLHGLRLCLNVGRVFGHHSL